MIQKVNYSGIKRAINQQNSKKVQNGSVFDRLLSTHNSFYRTKGKIMEIFKSVRSITAIIVVLTLSVGVFTGHIPADSYIQVSMIVIGAYFIKKDKI